MSLTEAGALYYEKCKIIVNDVAEAENVVKVRQTQVQGQLRIGSSVAFGRRVLIPLAMEFMKHNPQVQVDLSFEDRYTDLVANGIDVALRMGKLADSSLGRACWASIRGRWLRPTPICANTARRAAQRPQGTLHADLQQRAGQRHLAAAQRQRRAGLRPYHGEVAFNNLSALLAAARSHMGIAALPRYVGSGLAQGWSRGGSAQDPPLARAGNSRRLPIAALGAAKVQSFIAFLQGKFDDAWWEDLPRGG
ncbi:hypothetical protein J4711_14145 [Staphylococcus epidermidis]|nr:hypothetical protein [Staphylococcus epidermidis]